MATQRRATTAGFRFHGSKASWSALKITLGQMGNTGDAILGNVGNLLLFRLGVMDAERLQTYVRPELSVRDLEDLPNHHVAARLLMEGRPTRPFVFTTLPPESPRHSQDRLDAIALYQTRYTQPIDEVERSLRARLRTPNANI